MTTIANETPSAAAGAGVWTGRVLSGLVVAFMAMDITMKLMRLPIVETTGAQLGLPAGLGFPLGVLLLVCTALYVLPRTAVLGAILLTGYLGGAVAIHVRAESPLFSHVLFGVYLGVALWAGLWLRDARVRALIPFRA